MKNIDEALTQYVKQVEQVTQHAYNFRPEGERPVMEVETGRKYYKVLTNYGNQRSVHAFVDKATGDLYKPASWNAPAKGVRFNLLQDMDTLTQVVDFAGSYLYKR
jgi:hypothetical protein